MPASVLVLVAALVAAQAVSIAMDLSSHSHSPDVAGAGSMAATSTPDVRVAASVVAVVTSHLVTSHQVLRTTCHRCHHKGPILCQAAHQTTQQVAPPGKEC